MNEEDAEYKDAPAPTPDGTPLFEGHLTLFDAMLAWEEGELTNDQTTDLFQRLVDNGMAWTLQGMYGRQAQRLIDAGLVHRKQMPAAGISDYYNMGEI
jgi:hypothetical protein